MLSKSLTFYLWSFESKSSMSRELIMARIRLLWMASFSWLWSEVFCFFSSFNRFWRSFFSCLAWISCFWSTSTADFEAYHLEALKEFAFSPSSIFSFNSLVDFCNPSKAKTKTSKYVYCLISQWNRNSFSKHLQAISAVPKIWL